jgi:hypothetical protein
MCSYPGRISRAELTLYSYFVCESSTKFTVVIIKMCLGIVINTILEKMQ